MSVWHRRKRYIDGSEGLRDTHGNLVTAEYLEELAQEAEAGYEPDGEGRLRPVGRPSLDGGTGASPRVVFRVPDSLRDRVEAEAARRGCTVSQLAREALEQYLAS